VKEIPKDPWSEKQIQDRVKDGAEFCRKQYQDGGHLSGAVYMGDDKHWNFVSDVMAMY
jgi:hypothetical protein